jgi:hypothetical protein
MKTGGYFSFLWWSGTESTINEAITGLLNQPRMMMSVKQSVELLAGETEELSENLPHCRFVRNKIPYNLIRARTWAAEVGSRRLTA